MKPQRRHAVNEKLQKIAIMIANTPAVPDRIARTISLLLTLDDKTRARCCSSVLAIRAAVAVWRGEDVEASVLMQMAAQFHGEALGAPRRYKN